MTAVAQARRAPATADVAAFARDYGVYAALVIVLAYNALFTDGFLTGDNLRVQLIQVVPVLLVALGMAMVIGTEGIDLSVGAVMSLAAAALPLYLGYGFVPAVLAAVLCGVVVGLVNGSMVAFVGLQPIVATLALMIAGRGVALVMSDEQMRTVDNPQMLSLGIDSIAGIPYTVVVAAVITVAMTVLVSRTTYGRQLVAIGGNRRAAELAGLPVRRILVTTYVVCAVLAAIAGIIVTARSGASVPSTIGNLIELSAITAVVIGGTPLSGGQVRIVGTVAGALLLQVIIATLSQHNVPPSYSQIVQALIIVLAIYIQRGRST
ncbi:ABC transporter permease [Solicola gregarius]|uniref:ABC transporter permease n=1 Tax=Solicola gregarius TaxID=2908642 RepID=A0AA46TH33_9ACTN|nr:ABC transporter permease [Solicola gregarius]UYM05155.1 ABC transporter permease [Solicola gregarius]